MSTYFSTGCGICTNCDKGSTNSRGSIVPCVDKWTCEKYMKHYNEEKAVKEARKRELQAIFKERPNIKRMQL